MADHHISDNPIERVVDIELLLDVIRRRLGMEFAWISMFDDHRQVFDVVSGDRERLGVGAGASISLDRSSCIKVLDGRIPHIVPDARHHPVTGRLAVSDEVGFGSYIGVPVRMGGPEVSGMLCCISRHSSPRLVDADVRILEIFADVLNEISAQQALTDESRDDHRRIVDEITSDMNEDRLRMVFQAIVDPLHGDTVGVEALCRIDGSSRRPDEWFADAASVGIGVEAELAAIAAALTQLDQLPADMYMSVNASPETIADVRLLELLTSSVPGRLVVEITEHHRVDDYPTLALQLEPLRTMGVRIAIDDVGAGFSSFAHVLELRPDVLKLDRSIVTGIDGDNARQAIAAAVVDVGRRLGATVVAEGVETEGEFRTSTSLGIELVQGFFFCRPGPLSQAVSVETPEALRRSSGCEAHLTSGQMAHRFELAMLHSPIGMALVDLEGVYTDVNPALCELLGVARLDLVGTSTSDSIHPDDHAADATNVLECLQGSRTTFRSRNRYIRTDSETVEVEHTVIVVRSDRGRPLYFLTQAVPVGELSAVDLLVPTMGLEPTLPGT